jgi:hypothetical protein
MWGQWGFVFANWSTLTEDSLGPVKVFAKTPSFERRLPGDAISIFVGQSLYIFEV